MPSFQYEALKISDRSKLTGVISASNEKEAREKLREQELIPTRLRIISNNIDVNAGKTGFNIFKRLANFFQGISLKDKITFTRNMTMMVKAGIPVTEALLYFENYCKNNKFKAVVSEIRRDILSGYSFSQALAKHDRIFDNIFVNVTQAGERSGELEETLARLTDLMIKQGKLKSKIVSASIYPVIVISIMCIVMLIMFLFVIPTFVDIYKQMGVKLPMITQIMVAISTGLREYWFVSFPLLGASGFGLAKYMSTPNGRKLMDAINLKIPVLDQLVTFVNNSSFVSTLHISFSSGLPIIDALHISTQTIGNSIIRTALQNVSIQVQTGQKLAASLAATGHVPDIVLLMISIGEESGELEKMLGNSFEFLEEEVNQRVEILTAMLEPILLLVLGSMVCAMALSIYMPLYGMYDKFK